MIEMLLVLLIAIVIVWVLFMVIDAIGLNPPFPVIAKVIVALIIAVVLLQHFGFLSGAF